MRKGLAVAQALVLWLSGVSALQTDRFVRYEGLTIGRLDLDADPWDLPAHPAPGTEAPVTFRVRNKGTLPLRAGALFELQTIVSGLEDEKFSPRLGGLGGEAVSLQADAVARCYCADLGVLLPGEEKEITAHFVFPKEGGKCLQGARIRLKVSFYAMEAGLPGRWSRVQDGRVVPADGDWRVLAEFGQVLP